MNKTADNRRNEGKRNGKKKLIKRKIACQRDTFVIFWASLYIGFSMNMFVDQGNALTSIEWTNHVNAVGTDIQEPGEEAQNSLGS